MNTIQLEPDVFFRNASFDLEPISTVIFLLCFSFVFYAIIFTFIKLWNSPRTKAQQEALKKYVPKDLILRGTPEFEIHKSLQLRDRNNYLLAKVILSLSLFVFFLIGTLFLCMSFVVPKDIQIDEEKISKNSYFLQSDVVYKKDVEKVVYIHHKKFEKKGQKYVNGCTIYFCLLLKILN